MPDVLDNPPTQTSSMPKRKRALTSKRWWGIAFMVCVIGLLLVPTAVKVGANYMISKKFSTVFALDTLGFNPITGKLEISLSGDQQSFLKHHHVEWDWFPLFRRTVRINEIVLKDFSIDIEKYDDGSLRIGDIRYKPTEETLIDRSGEIRKDGKPLAVEIGDILLEGVTVNYKDPLQKAVVSFDRLHLAPSKENKNPFFRVVIKGDLEREIDFTGDIYLDKLNIRVPRGEKPASRKGATTEQKLQGLTAAFSGLIQTDALHLSLVPNKQTGTMDTSYRFDSFEIKENSSLSIEGEGFRSPLKFMLNPLFVQVKNLDSHKTDQESSIVFKTKPAPDSEIGYEVAGQPLSKPPSLKGKGQITNFDLPPLSPLAERFIGYQLEAGKLNVDSDIKINKGIMDSKMGVLLSRVEIQQLNKKEADALSENLGVPLETSLMLLQDANGDIKLDIPLKGNLNDPKIGLGGVYKILLGKGAMMAAKSAITTAFPPFKIAGWIQSGYKMATKLRFDDLLFTPSESQILPAATTYLQHVGKLMAERPGVRIKITGFGSMADLGGPANTEAVVFNTLPEAQKNTLLTLADARAEAVKQFLVQNYQIKSDRLFKSSPEFDGKPAKQPRVEIAL